MPVSSRNAHVYSLFTFAILIVTSFSSTQAEELKLRVLRPDAGQNSEKIERALSTTTAVEFPGNPLSDVAQFLSHQHDIPIVLDEVALKNVGASADEEVNLIIREVSLRSALKLMLSEIKLGFIIRNEVLLITSKEVADKHTETRLYGLDNLGLDSSESVEQLIDAITQTVCPETWKKEDRGIAVVNVGFQLIVCQSQDVHQSIENMLKGLIANSTTVSNPE